MKRLIVVDVSNFIFRAFFAIRPMNSPEGVPTNAVYGVLTMFMKIFSQYRPTHILFARDTSGGSFRNELYEEYKANRSEPPEDLVPQFALIRELLDKMGAPNIGHDNYEADDLIGSTCVQWKDDFDEILIASGDKDLMQFIGGNIKMLDTMKDKIYDEKGVFEKMGVRPDQIVDYLSMVGDTSDNIPGMRGIGAKGAAKLLGEHDTLEKCIEVKDTFKGKKLTTAFTEHLDDAILSKKLIQIVTDIDLGLSFKEAEFKFYPTDELLEFLKGLGFKSIITKLEDLKRLEAQAVENDGDESFMGVDIARPKMEHIIVNNDESFCQAIEVVESSSAISFHTEYDSEDIFNRKIHSISLSSDGKRSYVILFGENGLSEGHLRALLTKTWGRETIEVISEHWKRDCFFSSLYEIDLNCQRFDTTQAHYNLDGGSRHDLETLTKKELLFDLPIRDKKQPIIDKLEENEKLVFMGERACALFLLTKNLKKELESKGLQNIYYDIDDTLNPILSEIEREGILLNKNYFSELEEELSQKLVEINDEVQSFVEGDAVNLNSPKQVGELLFEQLNLPVIKKTKTGASTDSEVLEKLVAKDLSPVPSLILQYREYGKLLSTYVKTLPQIVHPKTGRVHAHFNQHVAATGRLSSNNPNLQNIPTRTELGKRVRKGFIARPGSIFLSADYSQVELRLLAHFSQDPTMLKAFKEDQDIHKQTASEVLGVSLDSVSSEQRSAAKAVNFGLMYGQSSFGLAAQLRISRTEAKDYITKYFERFNSIKSYLDSLKEEAERTGFAQTLHGRKRFLPDINSNNRTMKAMAERMAINSPIQGTAADIIKIAMIGIDAEMKKKSLDSRMILQVHDELIFEVPEKELAEMKELVKKGMESAVDLSVPLRVDMGTGVNWHDLK